MSALCRRRGIPVPAICGFTLTELVAILVILGVLAAVAIPRFIGQRGVDARAFHDQCQAVVRYAQKVAVAQRRTVYVDVAANRIGVCYDAGCGAKVPPPPGFRHATDAALANCAESNPDNPAWLCAGAPTGVTLSPPASFNFNGLGQPNLAGTLTITVAGEGSRTFVVERETGYVHP